MLAIMFFLIWFKVFKYLQVFQPLRYLIKMIFECIKVLKTFMLILLTAMISYAQIFESIKHSNEKHSSDTVTDSETPAVTDTATEEENTFITLLRGSYVLALGDLGEFSSY